MIANWLNQWVENSSNNCEAKNYLPMSIFELSFESMEYDDTNREKLHSSIEACLCIYMNQAYYIKRIYGERRLKHTCNTATNNVAKQKSLSHKNVSMTNKQNNNNTERERECIESDRLAKACEKADKCEEEKREKKMGERHRRSDQFSNKSRVQ